MQWVNYPDPNCFDPGVEGRTKMREVDSCIWALRAGGFVDCHIFLVKARIPRRISETNRHAASLCAVWRAKGPKAQGGPARNSCPAS